MWRQAAPSITVIAIRAFYDRSVEHEAGRLDSPLQRVEFRSTLRLIDWYFPPGGNVADVGSGPGRHAFELALRGYRVSLLALSDQLLVREYHHFSGESPSHLVAGERLYDPAFVAAAGGSPHL